MKKNSNAIEFDLIGDNFQLKGRFKTFFVKTFLKQKVSNCREK